MSSSFKESYAFLHHLYKTKDEFQRKYNMFFKGNTTKTKELYFRALTELERTISEGQVDSFKNLCNIVGYLSNLENQLLLQACFNNVDNPIRNTNLVILACKYNKVEILKHLLVNNQNTLNNLSIDIGNDSILPSDRDETCHDAFYYAMRSGSIELLDTLIDKWPCNYFIHHREDLENIISKNYEDLKLKNILMSGEMEISIESRLINLRFISSDPDKNQNGNGDSNNIRERIELVLEIISSLNTNLERVDEIFLFKLKYITKNIHILKGHLKSTYDRLPWEEIEFCLVCYIASHTRQQDINIHLHFILNKSKILTHLENFAKKLKEEKDSIKDIASSQFGDLPKGKRDKVIEEVINNNPLFEQLYNDYQQIRDICSLEKIYNNVTLALSADVKKRDGQLIVTRTIHKIGEYLKNTLESPKLSNNTSELLLLSLPRNTRKILIDLRNSLSHVTSLSKRIEIEQHTDVHFFIGIQSDLKIIGDVITEIFNNNKINLVRIILQKCSDCNNLNEMKELTGVFKNSQTNTTFESFKFVEQDEFKKIEKLIEQLFNSITEMTFFEKEIFNRINEILNFEGKKFRNIGIDFARGIIALKNLISRLIHNLIPYDEFKSIKFLSKKVLENFMPNMGTQNLKEIAELLIPIFHSAGSRMKENELKKLKLFICDIYNVIQFNAADVKWIYRLRSKLNKKDSFTNEDNKKRSSSVPKGYRNILMQRLSELKSIISSNAVTDKIGEEFISFKSNTELQTVIEILVLDILSILGSSKNCLENNLLYLDDYSPLLIGKALRNHLAHDNALVYDVLPSDPAIAVLLNAEKLTADNMVRNKKKIGKVGKGCASKLKAKYDENLASIINQEAMFVALEEGNLEDLKSCILNGADLNARNGNLSTSLHFAAKGPSLEVVKFVLDRNININVKDRDDHSPLHIATSHGRTDIVKFFIELGLSVDAVDKYGMTPLHIAARNGHKGTVDILLKNNANTIQKDNYTMYSPLHYAVENNKVDVVETLLEKEVNADSNVVIGGFTPLTIAAERGHLMLVRLLLLIGAEVNSKDYKGVTPLHLATANGHLDVVHTLVLEGADINARVVDGLTPLHGAAENGHEKIVNLLLMHGANVNAVDIIYHTAPLHLATIYGHESIAMSLLKYKANAEIATADSMTPLHVAAQNGFVNIVIALLSHGVNIDAQNYENATALHLAADRGHKDIVSILIENKAEVNAKAKEDLTPLHAVALQGHTDLIELLIKNNADVNSLDTEGRTPLHTAAIRGNRDVAAMLIRNKAKVNACDHAGWTPLSIASLFGRIDLIILLIQNKAKVNKMNFAGISPLHLAAFGGHKETVNLLIKNKAEVNVRDLDGNTPLHRAVETGFKEVVEILIANKAIVNQEYDNRLLISAIKRNFKEIVEILIANGANVNAINGQPILAAVLYDNRDIVEILQKKSANVNLRCFNNFTLLHLATIHGYKEIVQFLIKKGADVNALTPKDVTPLYIAAEEDREEIAAILIANGANINAENWEEGLTALHIAAKQGHTNSVEVLLKNKVKINIKDKKNRTPLILASAHSRLKVVKMLLLQSETNVNGKGFNDWTALHYAAQAGSLEVSKHLVDEGANINAITVNGSKPLHIAARDGFKDIVEYFLSKGLSINDLGYNNWTLLHYAAANGQVEMAKYLIERGINVNEKNIDGFTPLHIAAAYADTYECKEVILTLLSKGAVYNAFDNNKRKPIEITKDKDVIQLLSSTDKLFDAVKHNSSSLVERYLAEEAFINAQKASHVGPAKNIMVELENSENFVNFTSLHFAAWKGYDLIVSILLQNNGNPNAIGIKGLTPLHYAAKFSHLKIAKALLSNGAIYNAVSDNGKTPLDFAGNKDMIRLLKLVSESFNNVQNSNYKVINDLNKVKEIDTIKAVMNASNRENKSLVVVAMENNFPKKELLKEILQDDVSINIALWFWAQEDYQNALNIFKNVLKKRTYILGVNNPGTLDIRIHVADTIYKQGNYLDALSMLEEIFSKQQKLLGLNYLDTLQTRNRIALVLHRLERNEEALSIYQEVYRQQKITLEPNHLDIIGTQVHMALVLDGLGKYEEALHINKEVFEQCKKIPHLDKATLNIQNNIARVLEHQKKYEEALSIYMEVYKKKKEAFGSDHSDTLRTLHNIALTLCCQEKYSEALKTFHEVLNIQKNTLGPNHPDTINIQLNIADLLYKQGMLINAHKAYKEGLEQRKNIFGENDPMVLCIEFKIKQICYFLKLHGYEVSSILQNNQKDIIMASSTNDIKAVKSLLKIGTDVNEKDSEGRVPLHYAVDNGHLDIVYILLNNGADATKVTKRGNTTLHLAASKGYEQIVHVLLQYVPKNNLVDFINTKTTAKGSASLHVAAIEGSLKMVKCLLKHGATYDIKNKEGKTPLELSKDQNVIGFLKLVEEMFEVASCGGTEFISKLITVKPDDVQTVLNACNYKHQSLIQFAVQHEGHYGKLFEVFKEMFYNLQDIK